MPNFQKVSLKLFCFERELRWFCLLEGDWADPTRSRLVWADPGRLRRWLHRIQQYLGDNTTFPSVSACFVFVFGVDALVKSGLLSVSKWNAVFALSLMIKVRKEELRHSQCSPSSQCMHRFLAVAHYSSCSGSCSLQTSGLLADVLSVLMLQNAFPKATDVNSPSCFSNPGLHKCRGLSPSCAGVWVLQLVPYYLRTNTYQTDVIWHGNKPSSQWQTSADFGLSEGMGLPYFCYQRFIFSLLWTRNLQGIGYSPSCLQIRHFSQKPFLVSFRYLFLVGKIPLLMSSARVLTVAVFYTWLA